jgi:hypothetical protein
VIAAVLVVVGYRIMNPGPYRDTESETNSQGARTLVDYWGLVPGIDQVGGLYGADAGVRSLPVLDRLTAQDPCGEFGERPEFEASDLVLRSYGFFKGGQVQYTVAGTDGPPVDVVIGVYKAQGRVDIKDRETTTDEWMRVAGAYTEACLEGAGIAKPTAGGLEDAAAEARAGEWRQVVTDAAGGLPRKAVGYGSVDVYDAVVAGGQPVGASWLETEVDGRLAVSQTAYFPVDGKFFVVVRASAWSEGPVTAAGLFEDLRMGELTGLVRDHVDARGTEALKMSAEDRLALEADPTWRWGEGHYSVMGLLDGEGREYSPANLPPDWYPLEELQPAWRP